MHALTFPLLSLLMFSIDGWLGVYLAGDREEAVVAEVIPGSPAQRADLRTGDVIVAVDDVRTATSEAFVAAIRLLTALSRIKARMHSNRGCS